MELYISNSGQEPIYAQITRQIKAKILNGELQQGDAWYWLDSVKNGAMAVSKDVYQDSNGGKWVRYDANGHMIKGWDTNSQGPFFRPSSRFARCCILSRNHQSILVMS